MRHGKRFNHLGRTSSHRKSMLSNMASSLILNKKIETTLAKGKALRKYIEPLITKSKSDTTHSRRSVFSYLQNKNSVNELFGAISEKSFFVVASVGSPKRDVTKRRAATVSFLASVTKRSMRGCSSFALAAVVLI